MFDAASSLGSWLLAVAVGGAVANFALFRRLFRDTQCRGSGVAVGIIAGFAVHLPVTWALAELVIHAGQVPPQRAEMVLYYVGPAVLAWASLPAGAMACRWWSGRKSHGPLSQRTPVGDAGPTGSRPG